MEILTEHQRALLKAIGGNKALAKDFYLTGGTPLAAFYLHHRYSEDLDFFSEKEVDPRALHAFFKTQKRRLGITKIDFEQSYNRNLFFVHFGRTVVKTEFTYFPFPRIEKGTKQYGVSYDSLLDIAANKLFTVYQRTKMRDYIDLYCICQKENYTIAELLKKARVKFDWHIDPLQLGAQFVKAREAGDPPRMLKKIPKKEWQDFFIKEAKKLEPKIFL